MNYYKMNNGCTIATIGVLDLTKITKEEFDENQSRIDEKIEVATKINDAKRPLTESEILSMLIPQQINTLTVDDNTALRMKDFYPAFEDIIGQTVKQGFKFTYDGKLWKTEQPEMTIQEHYAPGVGTESLYSEVCETHAGTIGDPIPYSGNMALTAGMYYMQDWVIYKCTRDTGNPVYHALSELVGLYVEKT